MRVLFACGGTAGHINPAIAVADIVRQAHADADILFVGADGGMECRLVPRQGYEIRTVPISSLKHSLTPSAVMHNGRVLRQMSASLKAARGIVKAFRPNAALGTGGYASFPILREAARMGVPTAIHESNVLPGMTTKMLARKAKRIMVSFQEAICAYGRKKQVTLTGTPVADAFFRTTRTEARAMLGLEDDKPFVLSFFGSLGARDMNRMMVEFIGMGVKENAFHHMHATGRYGWEWMPDALREAGVPLERHPDIRLTEYIYDMPYVMAAADVLITRAGASTLAELMAAGKPAILVPSPNVTANHQEKNAQTLQDKGAAILRREAGCSGQVLFEQTMALLRDGVRRDAMERTLRAMASPDAASRIYRVLMDMVNLQQGADYAESKR